MVHLTGKLDCAYCRHFRVDPESHQVFGSAGWCGFHETEIPTSPRHRLCRQLVPTEQFDRDNPRRLIDGVFVQCTVFDQFAALGQALEPGSLYTYEGGDPASLKLEHALTPGSGPSAPHDDHRHRIETALLDDDLYKALWAVVEQLRREEVGDDLIHPLLDDYAQMLSGNIEQITAIRQVMGRLVPADETSA